MASLPALLLRRWPRSALASHRPSLLAPLLRAFGASAVPPVSFADLGITAGEVTGRLQKLGITAPSDIQIKVGVQDGCGVAHVCSLAVGI